MNPDPKYTKRYYERRRQLVEHSANVIAPLLRSHCTYDSVVDLGCADGTWLAAFRTHGAGEVLGVDGSWVDVEQLRISTNEYLVYDLASNMPVIDRQFDLACSIEVIEHIPDELGKRLVRMLTELAPVVLFSAAVPFQGGTGHINERRQSYWLNVFRQYGYQCMDIIRTQLWNDNDVNVVYRQNMFVYVDESHPLASSLSKWRVTESNEVDVIHPDLYELRMEQSRRKQQRSIRSVRSTTLDLMKAISHRIGITG